MRTAAVIFAFCALACNDTESPAADPTPDATVDAGGVTADAGADPADSELPDAAPEADVAPDAEPDRSDEVFELGDIVDVTVEMDPADWDTLRGQARDGAAQFGPGCMDQPFASPYDWFHAKVTVDGVTYDDVGIRKKGFFGSVSDSRPSVKIRMDKYVDDQTHLGLTRITLNNNRQDPSRLRTCLAYSIFRDAGVPTPRCNFGFLEVNGREFGVYSHVEALKKPFLARHFDDNDGDLYEGTLSDFRPGWTGTIEQKTNEDAPNRAPIDALVAALERPDDELIEAVSAVIDLDAYLTFWAVEVMVAHWDGYAGNTNNFWFYDDPDSGLMHFIPWGTDGTFQRPRLFFEEREAPWSVYAVSMLPRRLYQHPEGRQMYLDRIDELLARVWDIEALQARIDAMQAVIRNAVLPQFRGEQRDGAAGLEAFVAAAPQRIVTEIINGPVEWDVPLRDGYCAALNGELGGTFETTWGTWPTENAFDTGSGTFMGSYDGNDFTASDTGAAAGIGEAGNAVLIVPGAIDGFGVLFVYLEFDPGAAQVGTLDVGDAVRCSFNALRGGQVQGVASCPNGTVEFEAIEQADGAPVSGRFQLELWGR